MAQKGNFEIIREWYATLNPEILDENVDWRLADGFPADGRYHGRRAVFEDWWPRLAAQFEDWKATPERFLDSGEAVVALGHYTGRARATGRAFEVPFAHIWWMRDGRIVKFDHYTNTLLLHRAITEPTGAGATAGSAPAADV